MSENFEFKVGDIVNFLPMGDAEFVIVKALDGAHYPLYVGDIGSFTTDGKAHTSHKLPSLKLVRRPSEEIKWYKVTCFSKGNANPVATRLLYRSEKEFLDGKNRSDFHWIHLEEFKR